MGEFLILLGAFEFNRGFAVVAALGMILSAVYMLWMYQRVMYGEVTHEANRSLRDLSAREITLLAPLVLLMFWIGIYPSTFCARPTPHPPTCLSRCGRGSGQGPVAGGQYLPLPATGHRSLATDLGVQNP